MRMCNLRSSCPCRVAIVALLSGRARRAPASLVHANGTPIRIVLSHLNGVSNFGPQNATGVAELITSEGEVRLTAAGLQKLPDNEQYTLWISSDATKENLLLAPVTVGDGGVARVDVVLRSPIPEKPWDLMVAERRGEGRRPPRRRATATRSPGASRRPGEGGAPRVLPEHRRRRAGRYAGRRGLVRAERRRGRAVDPARGRDGWLRTWPCRVAAGRLRHEGGTDDSRTLHRRLGHADGDAPDGARHQQPGERPDGRLQAGPHGDARRLPKCSILQDGTPAPLTPDAPLVMLGMATASEEPMLDFTQGSLQETGRSLDLALEGPGFFSIQTAGRHPLHPRRRLHPRRPRAG